MRVSGVRVNPSEFEKDEWLRVDERSKRKSEISFKGTIKETSRPPGGNNRTLALWKMAFSLACDNWSNYLLRIHKKFPLISRTNCEVSL